MIDQKLFTFGNSFVFAFILGLTVFTVIYGHRKKSNSSSEDSFLDYLIMGRQLSLPLFVCSLVATWYGGIFGVTRISYESGVYNFVTQGLFWYVSYIIFALFLVKKIKKYQAVTLPHLVGQMFGPKAAKVAAIFNLFNVIPIAYTISIGLLIDMLTSLGFPLSMCLGTAFVLLYSLLGGFRAVIYSDLIQFFVMFISVVLVIIFSVYEYGGIAYLKLNLPETHFSPTGKHGLSTTLVWGFIALSTLVDPNFYQRCFAASSNGVAKKGILISTVIWFVFDLCTTFGGMYARALLPQANPQYAYMIYALGLLPDILQGFFLAGIAATIISTLDSYLFIAGTTIAHDLLPNRFSKKIWAYRLSTVLMALVSIVLALCFEGNIKQVWKILGSYSASCLLLPIMLGHLFPGKISDEDFVTATTLGAIVTTIWLIVPRTGFLSQIDALYVGSAATLFGLKLSKIFSSYRART
jgi:SSS family solute:Na+ symporter